MRHRSRLPQHNLITMLTQLAHLVPLRGPPPSPPQIRTLRPCPPFLPPPHHPPTNTLATKCALPTLCAGAATPSAQFPCPPARHRGTMQPPGRDCRNCQKKTTSIRSPPRLNQMMNPRLKTRQPGGQNHLAARTRLALLEKARQPQPRGAAAHHHGLADGSRLHPSPQKTEPNKCEYIFTILLVREAVDQRA